MKPRKKIHRTTEKKPLNRVLKHVIGDFNARSKNKKSPRGMTGEKLLQM